MSGKKSFANFDLLFLFTILISFYLIGISKNLIDAQTVTDSNIKDSSYNQNAYEDQNSISTNQMKTRPFDSYERFRNSMKEKLSKISTKNNDKLFRPTIKLRQSKTSRNCFFSPIQCQLNINQLNNLKDPSYKLFNKRPNSILKKNIENEKKVRFFILN
uniref:Uncharacterized protein n=1 Tax=Strongyloides stercoralis TaxID=6248 RepID=A0A0K0EII5_STRER